MAIKTWLQSVVLVGGMLIGTPTSAASSDALIEGAKLCTRHLPRYEREYGIPTHLLSAIASTESGRYHEGLKIRIPWPWTINADGKGYFFGTKAEAVAAARKFRSHGIQSMDVGCMQVNIYHHGSAFRTLEEAFEPQNNIAYAAGFLRNLYEDDNHSWKQAAADYHSKTESRGREYVGRVYNSWYQIVDKLRLAKLKVPESSVVAMNNMKSPSSTTNTPHGRAGKTIQLASAQPVRPLPEQVGRKVALYQSPRMNSIKVTKQDVSHNSGVIVVKPDIKVVDTPTTTTIAMAQPASLTLAQAKPLTSESSVRIVRMNNLGALAPASGKRAGPNFVFSD